MKNTTIHKALFGVFLLTLLVLPAQAQIKINEILASNSSINADPDYNANADWVELYNADSASVNLKGYSITDNLGLPAKFLIAHDLILPAHGYILFWCDDNNTGVHTNFKLSASGEEIGLFDPAGVLVDSLTFGPQSLDISYARYPDGSPYWKYYPKPTPAATNDSTGFGGQVFTVPTFSISGGFFSSTQSVEIQNYMGGTIRYTTNGSEPNESSILYTGAIPISKTTCLRARIFKDKEIPGPIATQSYFINDPNANRKLPVVSISTNPDNFWDPVKGIYVQTFKPEWEIPVNVELYENDGSVGPAFNEQAGIKVNGLYSWQLPQKMLGVYFKKNYGSSTLAYQLFWDRNRKTFKDFALRASGSDWSYTMFRDGMLQQSIQNYNMKLDNMAFRASVVYVNGQYMGIHNMREKVDEDFIVSNYNLSKDSFDLIENEDYVETGSLNAYTAFKALYSKDLSVQANFDAVAAVMDIENFTDLVVTETYSGNNSIDHNVMAWKPKNNGKWRWILMDLDRGFFTPSSYVISTYVNQTVWPFSQLMKNAAYKKYFGTRLANHLYTTFNSIRMDKRIDYHKNLIEAEMPNHIDRWLGTTSSYGDAIPSMAYWNTQVTKLKTFAEARPAVLLTDLQSYGFSASAQLSLSVYPSNAGELQFNGMKISETTWSGNYPKNLPITLTAVDKPGYTFKGWAMSTSQDLISKLSTWNYLDDGTDQSTAWYAATFDDASWKSGAGKFGYGDTQQTLISYGSSSSSKYITTYFRKSFNLTEDLKSNANFTLNLLRDDGAVIYVNGREVVRSNMPTGTINYKTLSPTAVGSTNETTYFSYPVDPSYFVSGTNVIAVEVHQNAGNSSDLGFDLQLLASIPDTSNLVTTTSNYDLTLTADQKLIAVYVSRGQNIVPDTISQNMTFYKSKSPYILQHDVVVPANVTLTIEPGVVIHMAPKANLMVYGSMQAIGKADDKIVFDLNPDYSNANNSWGALCFLNSTDTIRMSHVTIVDAGKGPIPNRDVAAISAFKCDLVLDNLRIVSTDYDPIVTRYGSLHITNSTLHSGIVGNLINVKNGKSYISNCFFEGNDFPDTDAIDYDNVDNGVIKNSVIRNFGGFNSDGIDLGESSNVKIDSMLIYNIYDKGVSIGLQTSVSIKNVLIMNTTLGFGIKDSSMVHADSCTFYAVGTPVANYEKIAGRAGGNAWVTNSIFSNSYNDSYTSDNKSFTSIAYSLSDNDSLPDGHNNRFGNPFFLSPGTFDFGLSASSPARLAGFANGFASDMGSVIRSFSAKPYVMISDIFYNLNNDPNRTEFIGLYNPGDEPIDLSGLVFSKAVDFVFPAGSTIEPKKKVLVAKSADLSIMNNAYTTWTWTSGSLANEGEIIRLATKTGIIHDQVSYKPEFPWPNVSGSDEKVLTIISPERDNHFAENWMTTDYDSFANVGQPSVGNFVVYPNPTRGNITVRHGSSTTQVLDLYNLTGQKVRSLRIENGESVDLSAFSGQILLAKVRNKMLKIVVLK